MMKMLYAQPVAIPFFGGSYPVPKMNMNEANNPNMSVSKQKVEGS